MRAVTPSAKNVGQEIFSVGLARFDGYPSSGVRPRKDVRHGEQGRKKPRPRHSVSGAAVTIGLLKDA